MGLCRLRRQTLKILKTINTVSMKVAVAERVTAHLTLSPNAKHQHPDALQTAE